jgi:hypothetical protein
MIIKITLKKLKVPLKKDVEIKLLSLKKKFFRIWILAFFEMLGPELEPYAMLNRYCRYLDTEFCTVPVPVITQPIFSVMGKRLVTVEASRSLSGTYNDKKRVAHVFFVSGKITNLNSVYTGFCLSLLSVRHQYHAQAKEWPTHSSPP